MTPRRRVDRGPRRGGGSDAGEQDGDGEADAGRPDQRAQRAPTRHVHGQIAQSQPQPARHQRGHARRVGLVVQREQDCRIEERQRLEGIAAPRWRAPASLPAAPARTRVVVVELPAARLARMADRNGTIAAASINHAIIFMGKPLLGCENGERRRAGRMVARKPENEKPVTVYTRHFFPIASFRCPCCPLVRPVRRLLPPPRAVGRPGAGGGLAWPARRARWTAALAALALALCWCSRRPRPPAAGRPHVHRRRRRCSCT